VEERHPGTEEEEGRAVTEEEDRARVGEAELPLDHDEEGLEDGPVDALREARVEEAVAPWAR
jgi:hypothetical protein